MSRIVRWLRAATVALATAIMGCSALVGPVAELNQAALAANRELSELQIAYAADLERAGTEQGRWRVDACYAEAFRAHRRLVAVYEETRALVEAELAIERDGGTPDLLLVQSALAELNEAAAHWMAAKAAALKGDCVDGGNE